MGQSQSGSQATSTSMLPGPQQQLANQLLENPSTQKMLADVPASAAAKSRLAGEVLTAFGGVTPDSSEEDIQSYANTPMKTGGKYVQQALTSPYTGSASGYTG